MSGISIVGILVIVIPILLVILFVTWIVKKLAKR